MVVPAHLRVLAAQHPEVWHVPPESVTMRLLSVSRSQGARKVTRRGGPGRDGGLCGGWGWRLGGRCRPGSFGPGAHELFGGGVALVEQAPGGAPEVFDQGHEVDHDRDVDAAGVGFGVDAVDLLVGAVDQGDPSTLMVGVAPVGFVEDLGDDCDGVLDDAGGQPTLRATGAATGSRSSRSLSLAAAGRMSARVLGVVAS